MSEQWERGEHPAQAEVHEPITEFDGPIGVNHVERPVTCPRCGDVAMFHEGFAWVCEACDYETSDPFKPIEE